MLVLVVLAASTSLSTRKDDAVVLLKVDVSVGILEDDLLTDNSIHQLQLRVTSSILNEIKTISVSCYKTNPLSC